MSGTFVAADALLGLLLPVWQLAIGCCVLLAVVVSVRRLTLRRHTRMGRALLLTAAVVIGVTAVGFLLQT